MSNKKKNWRVYGVKIDPNPDVCYYCKASLDQFNKTVDHLIPESRGGIRANKNKCYSCGDCNKLKADMTPEEFKRALTSMIRLESKNHRQRSTYLKRIISSVDVLIEQKKILDGN